MSAVTGVSSSSSVTYATQLAQASALRRSLNSLGSAIDKGDLTSAGSILTSFIKANPQYAGTASDGSPSPDPINQDFQALTDAISNQQTDTAKSAWTQVKSDLAKDGLTDLSDGTAATAKLLTDSKASIDQQILSDTFGTSSGGSLSAATLIGGGSDSGSGAGLSSSLISEWLTYKSSGNATPGAPAASTGNQLNASA